VICADELGPVIPRSFPPAPGWTPDGHRVKAVLDDGRGPEKTWVYGALRVADGQAVTLTAPSRNSIGYQQLLAAVETANPAGTIVVVTDNLSSHTSASTRTWLLDHPRIQHAFIPRAPAGSTSRKAGGGCFAARRLPGSASPPLARSPWPPGWRPVGSTPAPARGCGPPATVPTPPTPRLHLPDLRNVALGSADGDTEVAGGVHTCRWKAVWMQQEVKESVRGRGVRTSLENAWLCRDRPHCQRRLNPGRFSTAEIWTVTRCWPPPSGGP
jgi:DDE superfamily endonuclease